MGSDLIILFAFIILSAKIDADHVRNMQYIESHLTRFLLRFSFIVALSTNLMSFAAYSLLFAATFDQAYNIARGNELMYLGSVAKWDRFWSDKPMMYLVFKIIMFSFGVILLFYGSN
jgi:hypothetical protein